MRQLGAEQIIAVIGPCIKQKSYQVDVKFYHDFVEDDAKNLQYFHKESDSEKFLFDLNGYVRGILHSSKVHIQFESPDDTYNMPDIYPSYRRHCHNNEPYILQILSTIIKIK